MIERPEAALATIPGWEDASYRDLDGGLTNRTWLVETSDRKAVLKIDDVPRGAPFNSRSAEASIQRAAADAGIANRVLHVSDTVYLTEYVAGEVWSWADLNEDEKLRALADALRRLHALPSTGRTFDAREAAELYARAIGSKDEASVREQLQIVHAMPQPQTLRCCHNDLVAENIIATPDIRFLDWEYACDNDPLFDLATIVAHHRLSAARRDVLLDAYFDADADRWGQRLIAYERVYRALLWLWKAARR